VVPSQFSADRNTRAIMILRCNYEELQALRSGVSAFLGLEPGSEPAAVAAPPLTRARVEALLQRLDGDVSIETLAEQREIEAGARAIVEFLQSEMKTLISDLTPSDDAAVDAYMDFANAYCVLVRLRQIGNDMESLIEVMMDGRVTPDMERSFDFPD